MWLRRGGNGWEWRWYLVNCRERDDPNPNFYKADGRDNPVPPTHGWSNDGGGGASPNLAFGAAAGGANVAGAPHTIQVVGAGRAECNGSYRSLMTAFQSG